MIYLIEPYNAYQKPPKKKHPSEIAEEEALFFQMMQEQQRIVESQKLAEANMQALKNNQNLALPQYAPQPSSAQIQDGQYSAPAGGGGWVFPGALLEYNENIEQASFTFTLDSIYGPASVSFVNTTPTPNNDTFLWLFGTGSLTSTVTNPDPVVYSGISSYNVTLQSTSSTGHATSTTQTFDVLVPAPNPRFSVDTASASVPFTSSFTNTSFPNYSPNSTITYLWDFGDGTSFEGASPPPHGYGTTGSYIAALSATESYYGISDIFFLEGGITASA